MKRHLEPLTIAANITQALFCHLDTVLLTFGFLLMQYQHLTDDKDLDAAAAIMESLERRWAVADQQIFIAAVIVNPFYQGRPFAQLYFLNNTGIHTLLSHLWTHFYQTMAPQEFLTKLTEYLTHSGCYVSLRLHCSRASAEAQAKVCNLYLWLCFCQLVICCRVSNWTHYPYLWISHLQGRCRPHSSDSHNEFSPYVLIQPLVNGFGVCLG